MSTRNQIDIFSYKTSGLQKCLFIVDVRCVGFKPKILFVVCNDVKDLTSKQKVFLLNDQHTFCWNQFDILQMICCLQIQKQMLIYADFDFIRKVIILF